LKRYYDINTLLELFEKILISIGNLLAEGNRS